MPFIKLPNDGEKKPVSKQAKLHMILLLVNTLLFFSVYRILLYFTDRLDVAYASFLVMLFYMALLTGFVLGYLIYNRFLSRKGLTPADLDPSWSEEQKAAFLADGVRRLERSKWMMTVILPLVLTFLFDIIDLFFIKGAFAK